MGMKGRRRKKNSCRQISIYYFCYRWEIIQTFSFRWKCSSECWLKIMIDKIWCIPNKSSCVSRGEIERDLKQNYAMFKVDCVYTKLYT